MINLYVLPGELGEELKKFGGRISYHLDRLIDPSRSEVENAFAKAFVRYGTGILDKIEKSDRIKHRRIRETLGSEGVDTCLWWTLSPYVYRELKVEQGEEEALVKVLDWAKDGVPYSYGANLMGIEFYREVAKGMPDFVLSDDPNGFSHEFASEEARRIVSEVFGLGNARE